MTLQRIFLGFALSLLVLAAQAKAPSVELRDFNNAPRNVNEFIGHGKWAIVSVWAHDCSVCEKEIGEIAAFHTANRDRNAIVLGVSIDGVERMDLARKFVTRHKLPFVNLVAEPEQEVIGKFGGGAFVGTPTHYFYDPTGRIVGRKIGPLPRTDLEEFIEAFNNSPYARP